MRERALRAVAAAPLLIAALGVARLGWDLAVRPPVTVELGAACSPAGCRVRLPERRGAIVSVRVLSGGQWTEREFVPGAIDLSLCGAGLPDAGPVQVRLLYGWPGWRVVLRRAVATAGALLGG